MKTFTKGRQLECGLRQGKPLQRTGRCSRQVGKQARHKLGLEPCFAKAPVAQALPQLRYFQLGQRALPWGALR